MISNAACEPHVQDLCRFLVSLGARDRRHRLERAARSTGVERLARRRAPIGPEHIEVGSFIGLAAVTGGDITIEDVAPDDLWPILPAFERLGDRGRARRRLGPRAAGPGARDPRRPRRRRSRRSRTGPWPAFPADLTSIARRRSRRRRKGTILIFEKMFENRLFFVDKLVSMGARIILCDPHRVVVTGPARLLRPAACRAPTSAPGMAMLIAALCAEGTSTIGDVCQIDRGYERIDERLRALGASIERVAARGLRSARWPRRRRGVRVALAAEGRASVATGLPVLDHLVGELARAGALRSSRSRWRPAAPTRRSPRPGARSARALGDLLARRGRAGRGWALAARRRGARRRRRSSVDDRAAARLERRLLGSASAGSPTTSSRLPRGARRRAPG